MKVIVDTNVPLVANGAAPQASMQCAVECAHRLNAICAQDILVLDDGWHIINEYKHKLHQSGQPGVGDTFLKWVLTNWANPFRCELVHITPKKGEQAGRDFVEYPQDNALADFDPSDRKFVAVAVAHSEHPPILNATDSGWWDYQDALAKHCVRVDFLCPDIPFMRQD